MAFEFVALIFGTVGLYLFLASIKIIRPHEQGVLFTLGKFSGTLKPGLCIVIPILQSYRRVDLRVNAIDIPKQNIITRDNISIIVSAVLYFQVTDPKKAVLEIQDYRHAVLQLANNSIRDVVEDSSLDDLLKKDESTLSRIRESVHKVTYWWGINAERVELKEIKLPQT